MRLPPRPLVLALLLGAAALLGGPEALAGEPATPGAPAVTGDKAKAREWADKAAALFDAADYQGALDAMEEAEKHARVPPFLKLRAQALEKLGRLREARRVYEALAAWEFPSDSPPVWFEARNDASDRIIALDARIPKLTVAVEAQGYSVTLDGKSLSPAEVGVPLPVDPGQHTVVARGPNGADLTQTVSVRIGASERVTVRSYPGEQASSGMGRTPAYAAFGVGAGALAVGAVFGGLAMAKKDEVSAGIDVCGRACSAVEKARLDAVLADSKTFAGVSTAAFVLTGVGAAAGVTLLLLSGKGAKEGTAPAVRLTVGAISLSGRF